MIYTGNEAVRVADMLRIVPTERLAEGQARNLTAYTQ